MGGRGAAGGGGGSKKSTVTAREKEILGSAKRVARGLEPGDRALFMSSVRGFLSKKDYTGAKAFVSNVENLGV